MDVTVLVDVLVAVSQQPFTWQRTLGVLQAAAPCKDTHQHIIQSDSSYKCRLVGILHKSYSVLTRLGRHDQLGQDDQSTKSQETEFAARHGFSGAVNVFQLWRRAWRYSAT